MNDPIWQRSRGVPADGRCPWRPGRWIGRTVLTAAFLLAGLATGALLAAQFGSYLVLPPDPPPLAQQRQAADDDVTLASVPLTGPQSRPVYPFSIIAGGIRDLRDLEREYDRDPVVAEHYRGFNFRRARPMQLAQDRTAYVSYRIRRKVFWTSYKVSLHRGEQLLTDGSITARTRCGNQISALPRPSVSPMEPSQAQLEQPLPPMRPATGLLSGAPPGIPNHAPAKPTPGAGEWFPPPLIPLYPIGSGPSTSTPPKAPFPQGPPMPIPVSRPLPVPVSMPEPGELAPAALLLICTGLTGLCRHSRNRFRK